MASFFSDYGLMWYLEELNKKEFMKFKEVLKQEIIQYGLKQIPWTEVKKASRESLANLLVKYYEEKKAWDVTFRIFQNINRNDLSERAAREIAGHSKIYQAHLKNKLTQDWSRKFNIPTQDFLKQKFTQDECNRFEHLFVSKITERKTHTVLLKGVAGIGKTLMLAKLMLAWSEGLVFQSKFSYIFYLCCQDVKQLKTTSLAELISREWPSPSAPIAEILSQPEKLLFIIDSLEGLNCDLTEPELELCDNWVEKRPVNILLSSLLRRKMLPEASLLLTATPETFDKLEDRIDYTEMKIMMGFDESSRKMYIRGLFQDRNRAQEVFRLVRGNEQVFSICQVPLLCWVVATCLKNEIEKGGDPVSVCRRTTSVYTAYILSLFTPQRAHRPSERSRELLQSLCHLAAEGVWTDKFAFSEEDLRKGGILSGDISALLDIKLLLKSRESKRFYTFFHPSIQEFCAALFYLVKSHGDHPSKDVRSIKTLLFTFLKKVKVQWIFLGCFIFGLLHKSEQEKLEVFFGYQLSQKVKETLYECLETISVNEDLQEEVDGMKLFYCLYELEDDVFTMQAMSFMQHIKFVAKDYSDLIVAAYCLKYCSTLRKLSFSTQDVLQHEQEEKLLVCWQEVCSVLVRSNHIQILQVKDTNLDESAFLVLYNHLKHPSCAPQVLEVNNVSFLCDNHLFFDLLTHNHNLQHLNLSLTFLSHSDVKLLCDVLSQTECNIEKLLLANCFLSEQCWDYLSDVLRRNKTLSHLDIGTNNLKDNGLKVLCKALSLPDSVLKSLWLEACELTSACCEDLASTFTQSKTLWGVNLLQNALDRSGLALLCEALKQHNCTLHVLGLRIADYDKETQEFLIAEEQKNPYLTILSSI
ncbi:NACHT, LRR and PYD domains-containing protein 4 isoform X2 [Peromyscus californicus insignis]|uniref:NACHT, LRR and PYD domains-containing protein 4 isoform X2 n=1 Tax=Peromyscus californicus insignis TaxID=564181 RepID=UPI0022A71CAD|nr:NACHT, LRR and PYD domains-containing protein 4 isoform X2 [Peromyscus californicus insignis]